MRRIPELDGLRGVAALVIVLFHWRFHVPALQTAVDLFFVLSGYLITTILLATGGSRRALRAFYLRRALRILPIYYLTFPAFLAIRGLFPLPQRLDGLPYFLTYTQFIPAYWGGTTPPCAAAFGHTWTLAIEEQFYLFWPLAVWAMGRTGLLIATPVLLAMPTALRFAGLPPDLLLTRCDGLLLGAWLAAVLADRGRLARNRRAVALAFAAVAVAAAVSLAVPSWVRFEACTRLARVNLIYASAVGLIVVHAGHPALRALRAPRLVGIGTMSYGLYLYHPFAFAFVGAVEYRLGVHAHLATDLVKLAVTFAVAWLSWRFLERPLLALKDRVPYGPDARRPGPSIPAPHFHQDRTAMESGRDMDGHRVRTDHD
jgi:peptidoglycan/LPS O-acetylase OafA/YrhL